MEDTTLVIIIAAIPPTLIALATFVQSIKNAGSMNAVHIKQDANAEKMVEMRGSIEKVDNKANGRLSEKELIIAQLNERVIGLTSQLSAQEQARAVLAAEIRKP